MRRKLVVANRKMNGNLSTNKAFLEDLLVGTPTIKMPITSYAFLTLTCFRRKRY